MCVNAPADFGRDIEVWTTGSLLIGDTEADVKDRYDYFVHEKGDWAAAEASMRSMLKSGSGRGGDSDSRGVRGEDLRRGGAAPDGHT